MLQSRAFNNCVGNTIVTGSGSIASYIKIRRSSYRKNTNAVIFSEENNSVAFGGLNEKLR